MEQTTGLNLLPTEILDLVVFYMENIDLKTLSLVTKRLRGVCLRHLFRHVRFEFSIHSLEALQSLAKSPIRMHVVNLSYEVPDLLKKEILNFRIFNQSLYPESEHFRHYQEASSYHFPRVPFPPYKIVYKELVGICTAQHKIINESLDKTGLSFAVSRLPKLEIVNLVFKSPTPQWLRPILYKVTLDDEASYYHHLQAVLLAMNSKTGTTIELKDLRLSQKFLKRYPNFDHISNAIQNIIQPIDAIRYERAGMVLQALANDSPEASFCDNWICSCAFEIFLNYRSDSALSPYQQDTFPNILQQSATDDQEGTFNIWEPGWKVQIRAF